MQLRLPAQRPIRSRRQAHLQGYQGNLSRANFRIPAAGIHCYPGPTQQVDCECVCLGVLQHVRDHLLSHECRHKWVRRQASKLRKRVERLRKLQTAKSKELLICDRSVDQGPPRVTPVPAPLGWAPEPSPSERTAKSELQCWPTSPKVAGAALAAQERL